MQIPSTTVPEGACPCVWPEEVWEYVTESVLAVFRAGDAQRDEAGWLWMGNASRTLGRSSETVRKMCMDQRLRAVRTAAGWRIDPKSIAAWLADNTPKVTHPAAQPRTKDCYHRVDDWYIDTATEIHGCYVCEREAA